MKVYIVSGYEVYCDAAYDWHVKGFYNEEGALKFCSFLNDKAYQFSRLDETIAQSMMMKYDEVYCPVSDCEFSPHYHVTSVEMEDNV